MLSMWDTGQEEQSLYKWCLKGTYFTQISTLFGYMLVSVTYSVYKADCLREKIRKARKTAHRWLELHNVFWDIKASSGLQNGMFSVLLPLSSFLYSYWRFCNTKIACSLHFYTILFLTTHGFTTTWNGLTPHTWFHLRVKHHYPQKFFFWHHLAYSQAHTVGFFPLVLPCYPPWNF